VAARVLASVIDAAAWGGSRIPPSIAHRLAVFGGTLEWALRPGKRRMLRTNLAHAVGSDPGARDVRRLVRHEIVNEAHRSADLLWALGAPQAFLASVELDGIEHVRAAAASGRGVILAGIHLGGWELATAVAKVVVPVPATAIVADDWLAWAIEHMRVTAGLRVMYRTAPAIRAARLLQGGDALVVLGDDGWGREPRTHPVAFLDAVADLPAGIVTLSRLCQAPIVSFYVLPLGPRRWRVVVEPVLEPPPRRGRPADEAQVLQHLADRWSAVIRDHPAQWAASYLVRWHPTR
jgi:KDO2-lipid IV(A) lauroyltransferase